MSSVEELKAQVDELLGTNPTSPNQVINSGIILTRLVTEALKEGCGAQLAQGYTPDQIKRLQAIHGSYEVAIDNRFIDHVLSGVAKSPDRYPLQRAYDRLSIVESIAVGMKRGSKVMHIGTGWSGTAIGLCTQLGVCVTCVEKDPEFAERSRHGLEKLGLLGVDKIQVISDDGAVLNTNGVQAVTVSAMVPNKDKEIIIKNMRELATGDDSDPVLVLRTPVDEVREFFYQRPSVNILNSRYLIEIGNTGSFLRFDDPLQSLVFRVWRMAAAGRGDDRYLLPAAERLKPVLPDGFQL